MRNIRLIMHILVPMMATFILTIFNTIHFQMAHNNQYSFNFQSHSRFQNCPKTKHEELLLDDLRVMLDPQESQTNRP